MEKILVQRWGELLVSQSKKIQVLEPIPPPRVDRYSITIPTNQALGAR